MPEKRRLEISKYKGRTGFGSYDELLRPENDIHAPGSVDSVLLDEMIKLVPETDDYIYTKYTPLALKYRKGSRPYLEKVVRDVAGRGDDASMAKALMRWCNRIPFNFPTPEKSTENGFWSTDTILFGGTEEELIKRGTEICTEQARVLCVLFQVAGMPARLVALFDMNRKNWGHGVTEIYIRSRRSSGWAIFDATSDACYPKPKGGLASAWELHNHPELVDAHPSHGKEPYVDSVFYQCSAIVNYFVWDWQKYDYRWSFMSEYVRKIWEANDQ